MSRWVIGASVVVAGAQVRAGDALTPNQIFEGGTNTYSNWIELSTGALLTQGNAHQASQGQQLGSGVFGGIEDLHYESLVAKKTTLSVDGRSIFDEHDYNIGIGLVRDGFAPRISARGVRATGVLCRRMGWHMRCRAGRRRWIGG